MPQIPQETIEQVLAATNIVDLIGSYIPVKRAGTGFKALCPFHNEKTPSFNITESTQRFHCFGCGKGGDAIAFVREYENLPFIDAVKKLGARAGIPIIEQDSDPRADQARRLRGRLLDLHREATDYMHSLLLRSPAADHARSYLKSRGFGKEMAVRWKIGWMPDQQQPFLDWARKKKFSGRDLVDSGLAAQRDPQRPEAGLYLRFRDRLMFPVCNEIGDVIAFSGRQLREDPRSGKYVNSPETALFRKSNVLFALDRAKKPVLKEKSVLMVEGQLDVIACHESGVEHAIATLGTALTTQHARLLRRYTKSVLLCYDGDNAGFTATQKAFRELITEGLSVHVVELPKGDDPDSFIKAHGADAFRGLLTNAREFFDFMIDRAASTGALADASARAALGNECSALLAAMSDHVGRDAQINHVATRLQVGTSGLREAVARSSRQQQQQQSRRADAAPGPTSEVVAPTALDRTVAYLCHLALRSPAAQHFLAEQFEAIHEAGEFLEGVPLLEAILGARPDPEKPAAVNAFLASLPDGDRLALTADTTFTGDPPADPLEATGATLSHLAAKALMRRDARVKAALAEPGLQAPRMIALLEEAKEIESLLKGIGQRFVFDDELPPSTRRPQPFDKGGFKRQRNP